MALVVCPFKDLRHSSPGGGGVLSLEKGTNCGLTS